MLIRKQYAVYESREAAIAAGWDDAEECCPGTDCAGCWRESPSNTESFGNGRWIALTVED